LARKVGYNLLVMNADMEAVQVLGAADGEDQERGTIRGVVGSDVRVTRAACHSCRFSRAAQRVLMLWGGELALRGM
jgi:nucleoside diphosphate kinase